MQSSYLEFKEPQLNVNVFGRTLFTLLFTYLVKNLYMLKFIVFTLKKMVL